MRNTSKNTHACILSFFVGILILSSCSSLVSSESDSKIQPTSSEVFPIAREAAPASSKPSPDKFTVNSHPSSALRAQNTCIICGKSATEKIDGEWWCTDDAKVINAANEADAGLADGEYWCMGKGDTCQNKTGSPYDLYCRSCDPDGDNVEG